MKEHEFEQFIEKLYTYIPPDANTVETRRMLEREAVILSDEETKKLLGALEIERPKDMDEIVALFHKLSNYCIHETPTSTVELGRLLVETGEINIPKEALPYLDYDRIGTEHREKMAGVFTKGGYVFKVRDGEPAPPSNLITVLLSSARLSRYDALFPLRLPASNAEIDKAMDILGVKSFEECQVADTETVVEFLSIPMPKNSEIQTLNTFAEALREILGFGRLEDTLLAAIEVEQPKSVEALLDIAADLDCYTLLSSEVSDAHSYGEYVLYDSEEFGSGHGNNEFKAEVRDYIDFAAYGEYRMREDGVRETEYGLILRTDRPFPPLEQYCSGMTME